MSRVRTYIKGLDSKMEGGIPENSVVLICGKTGSMKSSLALYILYSNAINEDIKGIYITLEQRKESLLAQAEKLGMKNVELSGITIFDLRILRKMTTSGTVDWMDVIIEGIKEYKSMHDCKFAVIDSLDALYLLTPEGMSERARFFRFVENLRDMNITTFIVSEIIEEKYTYTSRGYESFIVDGIIHLDMAREGKTLNLYVGIPKMRETNHVRSYYPLIVGKGSFRIVAKD